MGLIDPVVDDADLHSLAGGGERRPPDGRCTDQLRRAVEVDVIGDARPDAIDARNVREAVEPAAWNHNGEPVQDDPVVPANVGTRNRGADSACDRELVDAQPVEVGAACRRVGEQALWPREGGVGKRAARESRERLGQRRLLQRHDDLNGISPRRRRECKGNQAADDETPLLAENGTD
jgi:hypothetical protein